MLDWGDGSYEHTAETLVRAAERAVAAAQLTLVDRVLDLGCGTGNAALEAARSGARVVAIDPAERLLEVARGRAAEARLPIEFARGDASAIPADDATFDAVLSVFAVIFAPDADRAASEMLRVLAPGGRLVLTSWLPRGGVAEASRILHGAMPQVEPSAPPRPAHRWGDEAFVRELFEPRGASVQIETDTLVFEAASAEAWFAEQTLHHPAWRFVRLALEEQPGAWESVRERSVECLARHSEVADRLRLISEYLVVTVRKPAEA
jgi:ubiquinone/menaquinone biosynthesis C-methylase UbiE